MSLIAPVQSVVRSTAEVVHHDDHAVTRFAHVELEDVGAVFEGLVVGEQGVLRANAPTAAMGDVEDLVTAEHLLRGLALRLGAAAAAFAAHAAHAAKAAFAARAAAGAAADGHIATANG